MVKLELALQELELAKLAEEMQSGHAHFSRHETETKQGCFDLLFPTGEARLAYVEEQDDLHVLDSKGSVQ